MKSFNKLKKYMNTEQHALECFERILRFGDNAICYYCKGKDFIKDGPYHECLICKNNFTCISGSFIEKSGIPVLHWAYVIYVSVASGTRSPITISEITGIDVMDVQSIIFAIDSLNGLE